MLSIDTNALQLREPVLMNPMEAFNMMLELGFLSVVELIRLHVVPQLQLFVNVVVIQYWDLLAVLQQKREVEGKRLVLFGQHLMLREQAAVHALPPSHLYK